MKAGQTMKSIKFVVRVNRCGARAAEFVQRIDRTPIQTTTNRKLALLMGRFTAEDAIKSIQNSRCSPELVSLHSSRLLKNHSQSTARRVRGCRMRGDDQLQ